MVSAEFELGLRIFLVFYILFAKNSFVSERMIFVVVKADKVPHPLCLGNIFQQQTLFSKINFVYSKDVFPII